MPLIQPLGTFYVVLYTLSGKTYHLITVLLMKCSDSKLHGAVLCCAVLCCAVLCCEHLLCNAIRWSHT